MRAYCAVTCEPGQVDNACDAAFVDFLGRTLTAGHEDRPLEELLLSATRSAAAARFRAPDAAMSSRSERCAAVPELLAARANGELADEHALVAHVRHCARCQASAALIDQADAAFRESLGWEAEAPSLDPEALAPAEPKLAPAEPEPAPGGPWPTTEASAPAEPERAPAQPETEPDPEPTERKPEPAPAVPELAPEVSLDTEPEMEPEPEPAAAAPLPPTAPPTPPAPPTPAAPAAPAPTVVRVRRGGLVGAAKRIGKQLGGGGGRPG